MGANGTPKKRGLTHFLHRQWINTTVGKELHKKECERQKKLPVKVKVIK
jgi:hypothetical protein